MIPFFRRIRKKMADENRPLKYARYAVGEIVLVVIGILIALQINTWNEELKTREIETKTLKEIRANLKTDLDELWSDISVMDSVTLAGGFVLEYLKSDADKPSKSFKYYMNISRMNPHFDAIRGGYSLLQSKGLDIISNDSLRGAITKLYEFSYPYYAKYENERFQKLNTIILPKYTDYLSVYWLHDKSTFKGSSQISDQDYIRMKNDSKFVNVLNLCISENEMVKNRAHRTRGLVKDLIDLINKELESSEN